MQMRRSKIHAREILDRIAAIEAKPPVKLTPEEERLLAEAEAMNDGTTISHEELFAQLEARDRAKAESRVTLRHPLSLKAKLEKLADNEGVSLNQYMLYKLAN